MMLTIWQKVAIWILPVLFAITIHEVAHGWIARRLGDPTAMMLGRLTLNPIKHIDPLGTILVPALTLILTPFVFGWAKPVPVTWENLKHPKRDMALVALAGPGANLLMLIGWLLLVRLGVTIYEMQPAVAMFLIFSGVAGGFINSILMILNLIPIPPLDGSRVLSGVLPGPWAYQLSRIEPYGLIIIVLLLATGALGYFVSPLLESLASVMAVVAGMPTDMFKAVLITLIR